MSAVIVPLRPSEGATPSGGAEATRRAQNALAWLRADCPALARAELLKAARVLEEAQEGPRRCVECGGTGFDEDARCDFCDGTGRQVGESHL